MRRAFSAEPAILVQLDTLRFFLFVFGAVVIEAATNCTLKMNDFSHF